METNKIYENDSSQTEFDAVVLNCIPKDDVFEAVLDQTCFFAEGGGQPADRGTLGAAQVLDVREKDGIIYHKVDRGLAAGCRVHGTVDRDRRFSNMQQHSGEHILSGIIHGKFGFDNVGFHIGSEFVTLDFNGTLTEEELRGAEDLANAAVYADIPVDVRFPGKDELDRLVYRSKKELEGKIRIVTFPGYDCCACCGTHVSRTGEIGIIKIISAQKYKGGTRVSILCGSRALVYFRQTLKSVDDISALLSARTDLVAQAAEQLYAENSRLKMQLKEVRGRLFEEKAASAEQGSDLFIGFEEGLSPDELRQYALLLNRRAKTCAVFSGSDDEGYKYAVASTALDSRAVAKQLNAAFGGRGGGSEQLAQGSVSGKSNDIRAAVGAFALQL